jgi:hypothetical protein
MPTKRKATADIMIQPSGTPSAPRPAKRSSSSDKANAGADEATNGEGGRGKGSTGKGGRGKGGKGKGGRGKGGKGGSGGRSEEELLLEETGCVLPPILCSPEGYRCGRWKTLEPDDMNMAEFGVISFEELNEDQLPTVIRSTDSAEGAPEAAADAPRRAPKRQRVAGEKKGLKSSGIPPGTQAGRSDSVVALRGCLLVMHAARAVLCVANCMSSIACDEQPEIFAGWHATRRRVSSVTYRPLRVAAVARTGTSTFRTDTTRGTRTASHRASSGMPPVLLNNLSPLVPRVP